MTMNLTSKAVDEMMIHCLFRDEETLDEGVVVDGIVNNYAFHPGRIAENADAIAALLAELPNEFQPVERGGGGGWTFLNACMRSDGEQWTGLHLMQERLLALGIAAGKAKWAVPKKMWKMVFPNGIPYVCVL